MTEAHKEPKMHKMILEACLTRIENKNKSHESLETSTASRLYLQLLSATNKNLR